MCNYYFSKPASTVSFGTPPYMMLTAKTPHTVAEELILPAALDMVSVMLEYTNAAKNENYPSVQQISVQQIKSKTDVLP